MEKQNIQNKTECLCCEVYITKNNFTRHTQTNKHINNEKHYNWLKFNLQIKHADEEYELQKIFYGVK